MKGNVFSLWLKEFCALVFTQSVQAFILAIVLILVAMSISTANGLMEDSTEGEEAAGILAIIALTSLSNMEGLVKKIFGLESSVTDSSMKGGKGGVLGTIAAIQMAKKAINNVPKVTSGIKGRIDVGKDKKKAELDYLSSTKKQLDRYNSLHPGSSSTSSSGTNSTGTNNSTSNNSELDSQGSAMMELINNNTDSDSSNSGSLRASNGNSSNSNNNSASDKKLKDRYELEDKLDKIKSDYKDKIDEINKNKREANKNIASGIAETGMGILGASAGAVYGLATGDSPVKNAGIGIGAGDVIGKQLVNIPHSLNETRIKYKKINEKIGDYENKVKKYNQEIDEAMRKFNAGDI